MNETAVQAPSVAVGAGPTRLEHILVNSYLVEEPTTASWVVVDTGLAAWSAGKILREAERQFGRGATPAAIILTHGHFDHVGGVEKLSRYWQVPVYAHPLELPYLTGRSAYPPPDPTVGGGMMARLAGLYPRGPIDLGDRVQPLPSDGVVPGLPGWRWLHTPGHSPGHISLWRLGDRTLIAGDAFVTLKQESLLALLTERQQVSRPPAYYTPDWTAAGESVEALAALEPEFAATGHGIPMRGTELRKELHALAEHFWDAMPRRGRYIQAPALTNQSGFISAPPPVPDPLPKAVAMGAALAAFVLVMRWRQKRRAFTRVRRRGWI